MPLVSVVIAARNARATLSSTLRSVLGQTLDDIEVIVVDDGSTDGTAVLAAEVGDARVSVRSIGGHGASAARNVGVAAATARYVSFIDADDLWTPEKLRAQWEALVRDPSAAVAYSWTILIDERGDYLFAKTPSRYAGNVHRDLLTDLFLGSGSNVMVDRERIGAELRFDEALHVAEDWEFQLRLARMGPFTYVPAYQVFYRLVPSSRSAQPELLESTMSRIAERELAFEDGRSDLARRVDTMIHEYIALQCLTRASGALDLRSAARHWRAAALHPGWLFEPRAYFILGMLVALAVMPPKRRVPGVQRLLRLYGRTIGRTPPSSVPAGRGT